MSDINIWAVVVSAVAAMVVGSIWYGPLFGKMFIHEMGMDQWSAEKQAAMKKAMTGSYVLQLVGSLVMFYVLAKFTGELGKMTASGGVVTALWVWIGFIVPLKLADSIWGGKHKLFWLSVGNMLITLVVAGAIIGAWH